MPHKDSPPPAKKAVKALGRRKEKKIFDCKELFTRSNGEIEIIPKNGQTQMARMAAIKRMMILNNGIVKIKLLFL
jgi:hypothetical protein